MSIDLKAAFEAFEKTAQPGPMTPQGPARTPQAPPQGQPGAPKQAPGAPRQAPGAHSAPGQTPGAPGAPKPPMAKPSGDIVNQVVKILEDALKQIKALAAPGQKPQQQAPKSPQAPGAPSAPKQAPGTSMQDSGMTEKKEEEKAPATTPEQEKQSSFEVDNRIRFKNDVPNLNIAGSTIAEVSKVDTDGSITVKVPDGRIFRIERKEFGEIEKVNAIKGEWADEFKNIDPKKVGIGL